MAPAVFLVVAAGCDGVTDAATPQAPPLRVTSQLITGPNPTGPHPMGEHIAVCKVGGEGTYAFSYSGGATGAFELQPGQCWEIGFFGGTGVNITLVEAPQPNHEVVSIRVDYLSGPDVFVTGTNTITNVVASGNPVLQSALVTFTNRVMGTEGCTPGYWKQPHHFDSWEGYTPDQLFSSVFENAFPGMTLLQVLESGGGGLDALGRHTVAALLNAASGGVNFGASTQDVIDAFNAVYPGSKDAYNAQKDIFEGWNERGCSLN